MSTSGFAALCWVMPRPVPKIAALLLITAACPLAIGWSLSQPARRHSDETTSRLCLRSNAIRIFYARWNARGHGDITVTRPIVEGACDSMCEGVEWWFKDVTFGLQPSSHIHRKADSVFKISLLHLWHHGTLKTKLMTLFLVGWQLLRVVPRSF